MRERSWMIFMGVTIAYIITMRVVVLWRWMKAGVGRDEERGRTAQGQP
jgi:hypothetical protein